LDSWVCRSSDGGHEWEISKTSINLPPGVERQLVPHGDIVKLSKNQLASPFYGRMFSDPNNRGTHCYFFISEDDGRTWGNKHIFLSEGAGETFLLPLNNNKWLAVSRSNRDNERDDVVCLGEYLRYFVSEDEGKNWNEGYHLTGSAQHPGHLLKLKDGRILLTYGNRRSPSPSIQILLSNDEGKTWNFHAQDLVSLKGAIIRRWGYGDMGYPSTVQLTDGTLVTAYYSWGINSHSRYHMGVVRWRLE
jgi:hypothetical protein